MRSAWALAGLSVVFGCRTPERAVPADTTVRAPSPRSDAGATDTLVLSVGRFGIWFAEGRPGRDSTGADCLERSVEIRTDSSRTKVPLLYTTRPPTRIDEGHIRAELVRDCRVIGIYRVELASGRPTKLADR